MAQRPISMGAILGSVALRYRRESPPSTWGSRSAHNIFGGNCTPEKDATTPQESLGETRSNRLANLEAVIFLAREPLGSRKLALLSGLADGTEARTLVRSLNRLYDVEGCAVRVVEVAGGFQLVSRAKFAPWLRRLQALPTEVRLSAPALETLAVIAYRQPVLRADIEAIRGVQCGEILRQLMERGLVRIMGKSEELGRPFLYGTTREFLQTFGLRDLDELPRAELYRLPLAGTTTDPAAAGPEIDTQLDQVNQPTYSTTPGEDVNVKTLIKSNVFGETELAIPAAALIQEEPRLAVGVGEYAAYEDEEEIDDEEDDGDDEDEDEDDEDFDDEDFEDSDWEEVEDDDEEEEDLEEDEDWEEEDEEEWDDEEDDEDGDWEDEEEEEEEEEWE